MNEHGRSFMIYDFATSITIHKYTVYICLALWKIHMNGVFLNRRHMAWDYHHHCMICTKSVSDLETEPETEAENLNKNSLVTLWLFVT